MKQLWIEGDRNHWLVRLGRKASKHCSFVYVRLWDGYKTTVSIQEELKCHKSSS